MLYKISKIATVVFVVMVVLTTANAQETFAFLDAPKCEKPSVGFPGKFINFMAYEDTWTEDGPKGTWISFTATEDGKFIAHFQIVRESTKADHFHIVFENTASPEKTTIWALAYQQNGKPYSSQVFETNPTSTGYYCRTVYYPMKPATNG